jgi:polysaccharide biosynthesis protein PslH
VRILWVKAGGLVPLDSGGKIRSYNILRELARDHAVTFFSYYAAHDNDQHQSLKDICEDVVCVPLRLPEPKSARELLDYSRYLFSLESYSLMKYCRPVVRRELKKLLERESFDAIVCDFIFAAPVIPWDIPTPKIVFTHNVEAMIWNRHYKVASNPIWKMLSWREWKTMERAERLYLRKADHVLAVSEEDRKEFLSFIDPSKITVIPTGVDVDYFQPQPDKEQKNSLVFTGSMDWLPNEDGIVFFIEQVLPLIRVQIPEVLLRVVGRKPSRRLRELAAREPKVELTGWVDDVRPYLAEGEVCIVPLRIGGGTRLKIFEAMAMGKAVVSTAIGAEGLPVKHGESILLADNPEDFARQAIELIRDPIRRNQIGSAAHKLVKENFGWASVAKALARELEQLSGTRTPCTAVGGNT